MESEVKKSNKAGLIIGSLLALAAAGVAAWAISRKYRRLKEQQDHHQEERKQELKDLGIEEHVMAETEEDKAKEIYKAILASSNPILDEEHLDPFEAMGYSNGVHVFERRREELFEFSKLKLKTRGERFLEIVLEMPEFIGNKTGCNFKDYKQGFRELLKKTEEMAIFQNKKTGVNINFPVDGRLLGYFNLRWENPDTQEIIEVSQECYKALDENREGLYELYRRSINNEDLGPAKEEIEKYIESYRRKSGYEGRNVHVDQIFLGYRIQIPIKTVDSPFGFTTKMAIELLDYICNTWKVESKRFKDETETFEYVCFHALENGRATWEKFYGEDEDGKINIYDYDPEDYEDNIMEEEAEENY